jgi:hypothetical protein
MDQKEIGRVARHEALHAMLAMVVGEIEEVSVNDARTIARLCMAPWQLQARYQNDPDATGYLVTKILACSLGPFVVMGEELTGADREQLEAWQEAWQELPGAESWRSATIRARCYVSEWYRYRREWVARVTDTLVQRRRVYGHRAWVKLVQECKPFRPTLTPTPRPTAPAPRQAQAQARPRNLTREVEYIRCLQELDWRTYGHPGTGVKVLS